MKSEMKPLHESLGLLPTPSRQEDLIVSRSVLYMSMSLDGFIAGPDDGPENGLGTGGEALHAWLFDGDNEVRAGVGLPVFHTTTASLPVLQEILATGAVLTGRRTFDAAGGWGGNHHDGVHIEVFTRTEPGADAVQGPNVRYATDGIEAAMARAKAAAGDRNVLVHGSRPQRAAGTAGRSAERARDPPGPNTAGRRPVAVRHTGLAPPADLIRIIDAPGVTHLRYRVPAEHACRPFWSAATWSARGRAGERSATLAQDSPGISLSHVARRENWGIGCIRDACVNPAPGLWMAVNGGGPAALFRSDATMVASCGAYGRRT